MRARLGWALGHAGHTDEARGLFREIEENARKNEAAPAQVAMVAGGLGDLDTGFRWLDEAIKVHDPALVQALIAPFFEELRAEHGYADCLGALQRYRADLDLSRFC